MALRKTKSIVWPILAALLVWSGAGNTPLILQIRGDIWTWSSITTGPIKRTNWGFNQQPIVAPNGKMAAYRSTATLAVEVAKTSGTMPRVDLPSNIWLMDLNTGDALRIVDQPPDASYLKAPNTDKYLVRSTPTWSPDSRYLAWTQLLVDVTNPSIPPQGVNQLVVYSLDTRTESIVSPMLPAQSGISGVLPTSWGTPGIAILSLTPHGPGNSSAEQAILIFDIKGNLLSKITLAQIYEFAWVKDSDQTFLAMLGKTADNSAAQWLLVDPVTSRIFSMPGVPEMYSLLAPNGLSVFPTILGVAPEWEIAGTGRSKLGNIDDVYVFTHALTISPDGQQIAFIQQGAAYVYTDGQLAKVANADAAGLGWGPVGWRVRRKIGAS